MEQHTKHLEFELTEWHTDFYPMVLEWWGKHQEGAPPENLLPVYGALISEPGGEDYKAAGWFSFDPASRSSHLDFLITNPLNGISQTKAFALPLVQFLCRCAKDFGAEIMWANVGHEWLVEQAGTVGFIETASKMTILLKDLTNE